MNSPFSRILLSFVLLLSSLPLSAQGVASWLESGHDFGTIREEDGKVSCVMRVVNTGDSALVVLRVRTSCGCTAVDYTREPLAPGDTGRVSITYSPKNRPGEFEKDIFVYTNAREQRSRLIIKGNVIPEPCTLDKEYPVAVGALRLSGSLLPIGEVTRGRGRTAYLSGYNASRDTLVVTTMHVPPHLQANAVPDTVPPGAVTTLTVHVDSQRAPLWGLNTDSLDVLAEPLHEVSEAPSAITRIEVMTNVRESFERLTAQQRERAPVAALSCGERLLFPTVTKGEVARQTFTITNQGRDVLMLRRLWSGTPGIVATADRTEVKRGKHATITVEVDTSHCDSLVLNQLLAVMTNDPDHPNQLIRLVGELKP